MSYYAVNRFIDSVTVRDKKLEGEQKFLYFDTEAEADQFIVERAQKLFDAAKDEVERAYRRLERVKKKHAPKSATPEGAPWPFPYEAAA